MKAVLICMSLVLAFVEARYYYMIPERCVQKAAYGYCKGFHMKWAYSQIQKKCYRFDYSGCGGNSNRFSSESDCLRTCYERRLPKTTPTPVYDYLDTTIY